MIWILTSLFYALWELYNGILYAKFQRTDQKLWRVKENRYSKLVIRNQLWCWKPNVWILDVGAECPYVGVQHRCWVLTLIYKCSPHPQLSSKAFEQGFLPQTLIFLTSKPHVVCYRSKALRGMNFGVYQKKTWAKDDLY